MHVAGLVRPRRLRGRVALRPLAALAGIAVLVTVLVVAALRGERDAPIARASFDGRETSPVASELVAPPRTPAIESSAVGEVDARTPLAAQPTADEALSRKVEPSAPTGPTYFFELGLPPGTDALDLEARLTGGPPFASRWRTHVANRAALRASHPATLHPDLPWVRFGKPADGGWHGVGWVELVSGDGRWHGGTWVEKLAGTQAEPLRITLEPASLLVAHAATPAGTAAAQVPFRLVERLPAPPDAWGAAPGGEPRTHASHTDRQGLLRIDFVEVGDYTLTVSARAWSPLARDVTIEPGENDLGTLLVEPRAVAGTVRGTVASRSGTYEGACHVSLSHTPFDHHAPPYDHSIDFEEDADGNLVAPFEFEDVTEGEWFVYVHCHDGFVHPGSLQMVSAPRDDVRIVLDDAAAMTVEIAVVDARTGAPLDDAEVDWRCGDDFDLAHGARVELDDLPADPARFRFLASAPGHRPQREADALRSYDPPSADAPGRLRFECRLADGFAALVVASERSSGRRVPGAEVWFDEVLAGVTDASGELWVEADARPERLRVECPGWRWLPSQGIDPAGGRFGAGPRLDVALARER